MTATNSAEQDVRRDLAAAHRLAVRDGLAEGAWNHLSVISPNDPEVMLITPGYTHWKMVNASNLAAMRPDGTPVAPGGAISSVAGWIIHFPVHKAIPQARCLMHVHSPYITALSMRKDVRLDTCSSQQAAQFHNDVAYYEIYDGDLTDEAEGYHMAEVMGDKRILMMRNHGAMVAAPTVSRAYIDLYQLERACMYQVLATGDGHDLNQIPDSIATKMCAAVKKGRHEPYFDAMRAVLDAHEPDYAH